MATRPIERNTFPRRKLVQLVVGDTMAQMSHRLEINNLNVSARPVGEPINVKFISQTSLLKNLRFLRNHRYANADGYIFGASETIDYGSRNPSKIVSVQFYQIK